MEKIGYCHECGTELHLKHLDKEGEIPYCEHCDAFRFRMFNVAMSAIVYHPDGDKIALIQQYGRQNNILVAGYVTIGEAVEDTVVREVKEELGLDVVKLHFNASEYYPRSNTLMVNFACIVKSGDLKFMDHEEVDKAKWFPVEEARTEIKEGSLAKKFLLRWLEKNGDCWKG